MSEQGAATEHAQVLEQVVSVLARIEQAEPGDLRPDTRLDQDLGMDSLSRVELQMALEEEFGIELADEDAAGMQTIRDVAVAVAQRRLGAQRT